MAEQQPIIPDRDKNQLKRDFRKDLKSDVFLHLFTQKPSPLTIPGRECRYCPQTQQLMEELAGLSPKIHLEIVDFYEQPQAAQEYGVTRIPATVVSTDGPSGVRFFGIPMGYELATVIEDIKTISRGVSPLSMETRKQLRSVNQPVHIQVFVTPACTFCPAMGRLAHALAMENKLITADVVEIQEFQAIAQTYSVRSVPLTVVNEHLRIAGAVSEAKLLETVLQAGVREKPRNGNEQSAAV